MRNKQQDLIERLLKEMVLSVCQNSLCYQQDIKIQGLLGITLDSQDVLLVQIDEDTGKLKCDTAPKPLSEDMPVGLPASTEQAASGPEARPGSTYSDAMEAPRSGKSEDDVGTETVPVAKKPRLDEDMAEDCIVLDEDELDVSSKSQTDIEIIDSYSVGHDPELQLVHTRQQQTLASSALNKADTLIGQPPVWWECGSQSYSAMTDSSALPSSEGEVMTPAEQEYGGATNEGIYVMSHAYTNSPVSTSRLNTTF